MAGHHSDLQFAILKVISEQNQKEVTKRLKILLFEWWDPRGVVHHDLLKLI